MRTPTSHPTLTLVIIFSVQRQLFSVGWLG